jgi:hypothetical protein
MYDSGVWQLLGAYALQWLCWIHMDVLHILASGYFW